AEEPAGLVDINGLARQEVPLELEAERVERDALGRDHPLDAAARLPHAEHGGTDAVRIAERDEPVADDQRDDRVGARAAPMHALDRVENLVRLELRVTGP